MIQDERLYIAAPICFYPRGRILWAGRKDEAEFYGFTVTCPNDRKPAASPDPRVRSDSMFQGCADAMAESTVIIADLENYRGFMPDGGTVYEVGMAYGRGLKMYAFTRDKRGMGQKYLGPIYGKDFVADASGRALPNPGLPFDVCLTASCKLVEGDFRDALRTLMEDLEEESKRKAVRGYVRKKEEPGRTVPRGERPLVYVSDFHRYDPDAPARYEEMRKVLEENGFDAVFPTDPAPGVGEIDTDDPMARAYHLFDRYQQHVRNCDIVLANLNDYLGYEPSTDSGFECGMGYELGRKLFAFMDDNGPVRNRVACTEKDGRCADINGYTVENLGSAQNLMFGSSVDILGGGFESVVRQMAEKLRER